MGLFGPPNIEKLKAKRDVKKLIKLLSHKDWSIRLKAAEALGKIGEPAVEPLITTLKDKYSDIREEAAEALGKIGDARAVKPLITALKDEDDAVRRGAAEALGKITKNDFGEDHEKWLKWWQQNKERFLKNK